MQLNFDLYNTIHNAQCGCKEDMLKLIRQFEPLIQKYARQIKTTDSVNELTLAFIEAIHKIPLSGFSGENKQYQLISYINTAIKNSSYNFSKKSQALIQEEIEFDDEISIPSKEQPLQRMEMLSVLEQLTPLQKEIIIYKFYYGYTDVEISRKMGISRQAVNKVKNRAFHFIRSQL